MFNVRNSLITFIAALGFISVSMLFSSIMAPVFTTSAAEKGPRRFYLTTTTHNGAQPLSACTTSYHMASVWEIFDPSNLSYNRELGYSEADSGYGPPAGTYGWIRTGGPAALGSTYTAPPGHANCNAWTVGTSTGFGSVAKFSIDWYDKGVRIIADEDVGDCDLLIRVWCIQD